MMEYRKANLIIGAAGGSAGKGSKTYKVSLPSSWINELGLGEENRSMELSFDGTSIVIRKSQASEHSAEKNRIYGHDVWNLRYYDGDKLCTVIRADFTEHSLTSENYTDNPVKTAFGINPAPSWQDFTDFLQERCVPKERDGIREYLEAIGLDEYDPFEIIRKTKGRMAEDHQWLEVEKWQ